MKLLHKKYSKKWRNLFFVSLLSVYFIGQAGSYGASSYSHSESVVIVALKSIVALIVLISFAFWIISVRSKEWVNEKEELPKIPMNKPVLKKYANKKSATIVSVLLGIAFLLYWYELRPEMMRKECENIAYNSGRLGKRDAGYNPLKEDIEIFEECIKKKGL